MPDEPFRKRVRRSNVVLEHEILNAVAKVVSEVGFSKTLLTTIAQKANVELSVIYRNFGTLDKLLDRYVHKHDYWLGNVIEDEHDKSSGKEEFYRTVLDKLIEALYRNREMQQLLIWELVDDNITTRRTAQKREVLNSNLMETYDHLFCDSGVDIRVITALIISGIYYLIIHKERSKFCGVNFNTKEGRERLIAAMSTIVSMVFSSLTKKQMIEDIVKKLKDNGVESSIIALSVGLTEEEISQII